MEGRREDLDALVHSPGWMRFLAHVQQEWGTRERGGGVRFTQAAHQAANVNADADAINQLRQVCVAQREIHNLIAWVDSELAQSKKDETQLAAAGATDYSRRGGL
jgi:succinyl-CoA synthetase beta subunit